MTNPSRCVGYDSQQTCMVFPTQPGSLRPGSSYTKKTPRRESFSQLLGAHYLFYQAFETFFIGQGHL